MLLIYILSCFTDYRRTENRQRGPRHLGWPWSHVND